MAIKNVMVPDLGGASDVDVIEVLIKPGDSIKIDTPLLTLESDKATMDVPSSDVGVVQEIKVKVGDKISMGSLILTLATAASAPVEPKPAAAASAKEDQAVAAAPAQSPAPKPKSAPATAPVKAAADADVHAGPLVRRLAREFGVALTAVAATGAKNRILKEDIQSYVKDRLQQPHAAGGSGGGLPVMPDVDFAKFGATQQIPLTRIQKLTGKNLHRNWVLVPHVTQFGDADITDMENFRNAQKAALEKKNIKLTPLVFLLKAVVATLQAMPRFNASLDAQGENLILKNYFNIGVAVDTPDGLVVPVIRDVEQKGLVELAQELSVLSEKARAKQLTPNDMQGGCFSISSLGGIGGTAFTPIVNAPEVAILGVSKARMAPVYVNGAFEPRLLLPLSLSYDHRVIDGADGARFIVHLANMLADIRNLLL